ncbi:hypothetical protein ILUMI_07847, partial [Ignelater luminosus]
NGSPFISPVVFTTELRRGRVPSPLPTSHSPEASGVNWLPNSGLKIRGRESTHDEDDEAKWTNPGRETPTGPSSGPALREDPSNFKQPRDAAAPAIHPSERGTDNTPSGAHSTPDRPGLPATTKEPTDAAHFTRRRPEATYDAVAHRPLAVAPASAPTATPAHAAADTTPQPAGTVASASDDVTHEPTAAPALMEPPTAKVSFLVTADVHRAHDDDLPAPTRAAVQPRRLPPAGARSTKEPAAAAALDAISEPPEPPPQLPRISAVLDGQRVDILVDTGATDNFVRAATSAAPIRRSTSGPPSLPKGQSLTGPKFYNCNWARSTRTPNSTPHRDCEKRPFSATTSGGDAGRRRYRALRVRIRVADRYSEEEVRATQILRGLPPPQPHHARRGRAAPGDSRHHQGPEAGAGVLHPGPTGGILASPNGRPEQEVHRLSNTRRRPVPVPGHAFRTEGGTGHFPMPYGTGSVNRLPPRVRYGVPARRGRLLVEP